VEELVLFGRNLMGRGGLDGCARTSPIGGEGDGLMLRRHAGLAWFCRGSGHRPGWVAVCDETDVLHAVDTENTM